MNRPGLQLLLRYACIAGVRKGIGSFIWIAKIVLPISLAIALVQWLGWLSKIDFILNPLMNVLHLPPQAALPLVTGMVTNIYAVIALITVLPFSAEQATLIAVFSLIAHNLLGEGLIQHKSGVSFPKAIMIRIGLAALTTYLVSLFFKNTSASIGASSLLTTSAPLLEYLQGWALSSLYLVLKILGLIILIMVVLEFSRSMGWVDRSINFVRPLTRVLGLSDRTAIMWAAANIFGLLYGGAVIVEEAKKGTFSSDELARLHISIGTNHSMIEDPLLFVLIGLNAFWLWIPRLLMAIIAVQVYTGVTRLRNRLSRA
jgi:hypothetical protein